MRYTDNAAVGGNTENNGKRILLIPLVICVILAFGIWLYVVNISTDSYERTFTLKNITVNGADLLAERSNMSVIEQPMGTVMIRVSGLRSDVINLTADDFVASVDVGYLDTAGHHSVDLSAKIPAGVTLVTIEPATVNVSIDEIKTLAVPVEIEFSSYTMDSTYYFGKVEQDIKEITVKGPGTVLDKIECARATLELGTVTTSVVQRAELQLINKITGKPLESQYTKFITMADAGVTVDIPVRTKTEVVLDFSYEAGFDKSLVKSVTVSPVKITVEGDPKTVGQIGPVSVITINDKTPEHSEISIKDLSLPAGVKIDSVSDIISVDISFVPPPETQPDVDVDATVVPDDVDANPENGENG